LGASPVKLSIRRRDMEYNKGGSMAYAEHSLVMTKVLKGGLQLGSIGTVISVHDGGYTVEFSQERRRQEPVIEDFTENELEAVVENIYAEMVKAGVEIDHHESDLYVPVTPVTQDLVRRFKFKCNVTTFISQIDPKIPWYDIPFNYQPFWTEVHEHCRFQNIDRDKHGI
jgi:hypothetical protein